MKKLQDQNVFDRQFGYHVAMMIESGLIDYHYYSPWTDEIIMSMDNPPYWILELTTTKYRPKAVQIIREFDFSGPYNSYGDSVYADNYLACFYLRYERGELSWATFLRLSGDATDGNLYFGHRQCDDFYADLNILEASEFSKRIEQQQREEFERDYATAIASVQTLYEGFLEYFRANKAKG